MISLVSLLRASPVFAMCLLAGCGGAAADRPEIGTVQGTVTLDSAPLADATVMFYPAEGRASVGKTDAEGHYELQYTADIPGAKVGSHAVKITTAEDSAEHGAGQTERLPATYNSASTLTAEVEAGENTHDFALKSTP